LGGNKVVMTTHGIYPYRSIADALAKRIYDYTLGEVNIRLFDALIALTQETRDALIWLGAQREKIWVIPNSINIERFEKLPPPDVFLNKCGVVPNTKIILYVGRVDWNKGLDLALTSFSLIAEELPEAVMVILGRDFGYLSQLRDLSCRLGLKDRVLFLGEVSEAMLHSAYSAAEVLLLSSVYEGLPTVVLEAMACGVPVIAFRAGGTAYTIEHGKTGLLADYGDYKGMAEQLLSVLSDGSFKNRLVRNAREVVQKHYSWAKNSRRVEELYKYVTQNKGKIF
jgi:glycosyltransferase involved in cell wall biosynthesis